MTVFAENFRAARDKLNLSQDTIASEFNVSQKTVSNWDRGRNEPPIEFIRSFCSKYHININWLLTGEGKMFVNENCLCEKSPSYNNTDPEIDEMVELLQNMPAEKRHECLILCREKKLLFDIMSERIQKSKKQAG
jgi:transcriptional regulator with XRE-family HTH domain